MNSFSLVYCKMLALRDFNAFHIVAASIKQILLERSWPLCKMWPFPKK